MAPSDRDLEKRDAAKAKRESKRSAKSQRLDSLRASSGDVEFGWGNVDPRAIASLVSAVTSAGGAVMLAVTSDGGALAVTLYDNGDRERVYIGRSDDVLGELEYLTTLWM